MHENPTNSNETRQWDDRTWYYCALCKQGRGGWSPSHSTKGDPDKKIAAHPGGTKPPYKRETNNAGTPSPKKTRFNNDRSKFRTMQAIFASKGKSLQELLKSRQQAADADSEN
jgi:outer membrane protein assembly factor BamE (lipoprotein component of BamABCDE complex)